MYSKQNKMVGLYIYSSGKQSGSFSIILGVPIINLKKTYEKLLLAARVIAAVENPADICVLSHRNYGQVCSDGDM